MSKRVRENRLVQLLSKYPQCSTCSKLILTIVVEKGNMTTMRCDAGVFVVKFPTYSYYGATPPFIKEGCQYYSLFKGGT